MLWVETPTKWINLERATLISIEPSDREPGHWVVLAQLGSRTNFVASFPSRDAAAVHVADLLFGGEQ